MTTRTDSVATIVCESAFPVVYEFWAGENLMVETRIETNQHNKSILLSLAEANRYTVIAERNGEVLVLKHPAGSYKPIHLSQDRILEESISLIVYIPENFNLSSGNVFKKISDLQTLNK